MASLGFSASKFSCVAVVSGRRDVQGGFVLLLSSFLRVSSSAWLKGIGNGRYPGVGRRSGSLFIAYSKIYILPF